ncbi:MAG TPA: hypothetical protein VLI40_09600 [Gemmatimonadaceae bacterium]|nr:hypothetical protein [Gemmatimonadaceae bacterium]
MHSPRTLALAALPVLLLAACAKKDRTTPELQAAGQPTATPPAKQPVTACAMVTEAEMSKILGVTVAAEPHEKTSDQTECIYKPASGISPYVDFTLTRGDGEAAMTAAGMMNQHEAGIASPYEGIGDQAVAVGPTLMIRTGEDLVQLVFSGVTDAPAAAKKIFDTAKPRM